MAGAQRGAPARSGKSTFERVIERVATSVGDTIGWMAEHGVLFAVFAVLWIAFGVGLAFNPGSIDQAWATLGSQSLAVQLVIWLLFLPVMAGMWIVQTDWPQLVQVTLVIALAFWTLLVLRPAWLRLPDGGED